VGWEEKAVSSFEGRTYFFLFATTDGKRKLSFGRTPEEAFNTLKLRLTEAELVVVNPADFLRCKQEEYRQYLSQLG
jgi:hypothetical protein